MVIIPFGDLSLIQVGKVGWSSIRSFISALAKLGRYINLAADTDDAYSIL